MSNINRTPYNTIPEEWAFHPTIGPFIRDILEMLRQTRDRTGGDSDVISSTTIREGYPWQTPDSDQGDSVAALYSSIQPNIPAFRAVTVSGGQYTAVPNDFISAKRSCKVIFPAQPEENSVIIVRNSDGSLISLDGNNKNINGSATGKLKRKGSAIHFHYFMDSDEWFAR